MPGFGRGAEDLGIVSTHRGAKCVEWGSAYWENNGNAAPNSLASIQRCLLTEPQILHLAAVALPAGDRGAMKKNLDALARRQGRDDLLAGAGAHDVDLRSGACGRRRIDGGGTVGAVGHFGVVGDGRGEVVDKAKVGVAVE